MKRTVNITRTVAVEIEGSSASDIIDKAKALYATNDKSVRLGKAEYILGPTANKERVDVYLKNSDYNCHPETCNHKSHPPLTLYDSKGKFIAGVNNITEANVLCVKHNYNMFIQTTRPIYLPHLNKN